MVEETGRQKSSLGFRKSDQTIQDAVVKAISTWSHKKLGRIPASPNAHTPKIRNTSTHPLSHIGLYGTIYPGLEGLQGPVNTKPQTLNPDSCFPVAGTCFNASVVFVASNLQVQIVKTNVQSMRVKHLGVSTCPELFSCQPFTPNTICRMYIRASACGGIANMMFKTLKA